MNLSGIHFGQMDVRVTIEEPSISVNATSSERLIDEWTTVRTVWAKRLSVSDEKIEAHQGVSLTAGSYLIRFFSGVDSTMRVREDDEYHYIKGIEKVDRKSYLILKTERRDNGEG